MKNLNCLCKECFNQDSSEIAYCLCISSCREENHCTKTDCQYTIRREEMVKKDFGFNYKPLEERK